MWRYKKTAYPLLFLGDLRYQIIFYTTGRQLTDTPTSDDTRGKGVNLKT